MLTREQLIRLSREVDAPDVGIFEKDYVISCLLDGLIQVEMLGETLVF